MTKAEFEMLFVEAMNSLRQQAFTPKDTGNLAYNAIKGTWSGNKTFRIYVDEAVAPYMIFTNEKWGKGTNPNLNWFKKAVEYITKFISNRLNGEIK